MRHRLSRFRAWQRPVLAVTIAGTGLSIALLALALRAPSNSFEPEPSAAVTDEQPFSFDTPINSAATSAATLANAFQDEHAICENSVVAGGVHSPEDVERAVTADPVVREHYSSVSLKGLKLAKAPARREAFMSYRVGDRVFWTANKVALAEGETVLTDGTTTIRARCGSLLSDGALTPTSAQEPSLVAVEESQPIAVPSAFAKNDGSGDSPLDWARVTPAPSSAMNSGSAPRAGSSGSGGFAGGGGSAPSRADKAPSGATGGAPLADQTTSKRFSLAAGGNDVAEAHVPSEIPGIGIPGGGIWNHPGGGSNGASASAGDHNQGNQDWAHENARFGGAAGLLIDPGLDRAFTDESGPTSGVQNQLLAGGSSGQAAADVVPVPEPATLVLFGSGLALTAWRVRRRPSKHTS